MRKFPLVLLLLWSSFSAAAGDVFFVPGWLTGFDGREGCVRIIRDIYPGRNIIVKSWDSRRPWEVAKRNAAAYTGKLLQEILAMPDGARRDLVLIGHSIGVSIVLDIADELIRRGMKIHSLILLGGAVPEDDPRIRRALDVVRTYCCNVYNARDGVLRYLFPLDNGMRAPLGLTGWSGHDRRFFEAALDNDRSAMLNHFAYLYLERFGELLAEVTASFAAVEVMQDDPNVERRPADEIFWTTIRQYGEWRLQEHRRGKCRILDPEGIRRASGDPKKMREAFDDVIRQLTPAR